MARIKYVINERRLAYEGGSTGIPGEGEQEIDKTGAEEGGAQAVLGGESEAERSEAKGAEEG